MAVDYFFPSERSRDRNAWSAFVIIFRERFQSAHQKDKTDQSEKIVNHYK